MLLKRVIAMSALLLASSACVPCFADTVTFMATLSGASEVPPNSSTATGSATVTLNGNLLTVMETFSGLTTPAAAGHIHCCAPVGTNAAVVVPFPSFPAGTAGMYTSVFDLSTIALGGGVTEAQLIAGLESGMAYVNIHDSVYPGGEIEGQLYTVTPEPGSLVLLGTGLLGAVGVLRRRLA